MASLVSTADVLTMLKSTAQPGTVLYQQIDMLRRNVEAAVKRYCKWPLLANEGLGQGNYSDYYDGKGYPDLCLRRLWVANVSAVHLDMLAYGGQNTNNYTPFGSATLQVPGQNYMVVFDGPSSGATGISRGGVVRYLASQNTSQGLWPSDFFLMGRGGLSYQPPPGWPVGYGNVKVTYDWGFQPSTAIATLSWSAGVATMTFSSPVVCYAGEPFQITGDAVWNGDYMVASVSSNFQTVTFNTPTNLGALSGGSADFVPVDIKMAVAEAVSLMRNKVIYGGPVTGENLGDYSYSLTLFEHPMFGDVKQLLSGYRDLSAAINLF